MAKKRYAFFGEEKIVNKFDKIVRERDDRSRSGMLYVLIKKFLKEEGELS